MTRLSPRDARESISPNESGLGVRETTFEEAARQLKFGSRLN